VDGRNASADSGAASPIPDGSPAKPSTAQDGAPLVPPSLTDGPETLARHFEANADLIRLFSLRDFTDEERKAKRPERLLEIAFGPGAARINQGNRKLSLHDITYAQCMDGLRGITLQTEEQRRVCGADYMVPVYAGGDPKAAKFCIDIFEFPNKPCELPMVYSPPTMAASICAYQGKRLCAQEEWNLACRADPAGGPDWIYAYGNELDLAICNSNKRHQRVNGARRCDTYTAARTWETCGTDSEPSGAFPKCRSRFGVFDQHGNVAEVMTRMDKEKGLVSQLKGSAYFYVEVARSHTEKQGPGVQTYPDHCNFDPRWHVEPMSKALHVNYHLGFRCCKSL
jgi:hypothetical protein